MKRFATVIGVSLMILQIAGSAAAMKPEPPGRTRGTPATLKHSDLKQWDAGPSTMLEQADQTAHVNRGSLASQNTTSEAVAIGIPWLSISGGGTEGDSPNYQVGNSIGQSTIGLGASAGFKAGVGYWYGVQAITGCACPFQGDMNADGIPDAVDLNAVIEALFFNGSNAHDPNCPTTRADFNNDGFADSTDLNLLINQLFFNGPPPTDPCSP